MKMLFIFWVCSNQIFKQFAKVCDFLSHTIYCPMPHSNVHKHKCATSVSITAMYGVYCVCMVCRRFYEYFKNHLKLVQHQHWPTNQSNPIVCVCGLYVYIQLVPKPSSMWLYSAWVVSAIYSVWILHFAFHCWCSSDKCWYIANLETNVREYGRLADEKSALVCLFCIHNTHKY